MKHSEINALISLLDDSDYEVSKVVSENLLCMGLDVIPLLESAWEYSVNDKFQGKVENIIQSIQLNVAERNLNEWIRSGAEDMLEGAFYVANYQYPELEFDAVKVLINRIREDVWLELNNNLTAFEKIKVLNHVFFTIHKFTVNSVNQYSPQNSFINHVLETKRGNQLTLPIIYCAIARSLGMPVYGVNLPVFILAYVDEDSLNGSTEIGKENILFYINPFNKGGIFGAKEIENYLQQQKIMPRSTHFTPCNNIVVVQRLLLNLISSYDRLGYPDKIDHLKKLLKVVDYEEIE
jgi:regulator of sirC expression with transglutaminase-like and TPR domain